MQLTSRFKKIMAGSGTAFLALLAHTLWRPRGRRQYPAADTLLLAHPELALPERFIELKNGLNFRDAGGYRATVERTVRLGRLYRSGSLAELSDADLETLSKLRLKLICDLRTPGEVARGPGQLTETLRAGYINLPAYVQNNYSDWLRTALFRRHALDDVIADGYLRLVDQHALKLGRVLKRLADPDNLPALVHCTAGKDRTGVVVALLLAVLGVPEETILADYALSNSAFDRICHISRRDIQRMHNVGITENEIIAIMSANPLNLRRMFAHLRARYGSVEHYLLTAAGLSLAELQRLRENFLEATGGSRVEHAPTV
ncbi:MAG: tyrosine-protein phosphatase [Anaerolineales bacterium]